MIAFSVAPVSEEMSEAVARAVKIVRESGLPNETNAMFTLIEGECVARVHLVTPW